MYPPISVKVILIIINITACNGFRLATPFKSVRLYSIMFAGIVSNKAIATPISPDVIPIINVSALNTLVMSFFLAPRLLSTPIYFVLSSTDMYVIIPIIIDDTTSDIDENATNTIVIADIIDPLILLIISA